uniref:Uncharacterized protein n=1 Tax=Hyaloperonospora arabidopsidis (strain Emoy2) TaxID=559515 RepID=M4BND5_HYAAE
MQCKSVLWIAQLAYKFPHVDTLEAPPAQFLVKLVANMKTFYLPNVWTMICISILFWKIKSLI